MPIEPIIPAAAIQGVRPASLRSPSLRNRRISKQKIIPCSADEHIGSTPAVQLLLAVSPESPLAVSLAEPPPDLDQRATRVKVDLNSTASVSLSVREDL